MQKKSGIMKSGLDAMPLFLLEDLLSNCYLLSWMRTDGKLNSCCGNKQVFKGRRPKYSIQFSCFFSFLTEIKVLHAGCKCFLVFAPTLFKKQILQHTTILFFQNEISQNYCILDKTSLTLQLNYLLQNKKKLTINPTFELKSTQYLGR